MNLPRVLLADNDRELLDLLAYSLSRAGIQSVRSDDARSALEILIQQSISLAVLDINLDDGRGFELLEAMRLQSDVPILVLSERASEDDKVQGFTLGADDYVVKPFSHRELIARVRAHLRRRGLDQRATAHLPAVIATERVTMDPGNRAVCVDGQPIHLSDTEFRLLYLLMRHAGHVVQTGAMLKDIWRDERPTRTDLVRVNVHRLRRKLESAGLPVTAIQTIPRVGVVFHDADLKNQAEPAWSHQLSSMPGAPWPLQDPLRSAASPVRPSF